MAWIELHQSFWDHAKTTALAEILDMEPLYAAAHLAHLWTWSLDNAPDGDLTGLRPRSIAVGSAWRGDPDQFIDAAVEAGFLDRDGDTLTIHDWADYAGRRFERRRQSRERPVRRRPFMRREWERLSRSIRPLILDRDGARCRYCGRTDGPLHIDHITPIARGGSNELANLQVLCAPCNRAKGAR